MSLERQSQDAAQRVVDLLKPSQSPFYSAVIVGCFAVASVCTASTGVAAWALLAFVMLVVGWSVVRANKSSNDDVSVALDDQLRFSRAAGVSAVLLAIALYGKNLSQHPIALVPALALSAWHVLFFGAQVGGRKGFAVAWNLPQRSLVSGALLIAFLHCAGSSAVLFRAVHVAQVGTPYLDAEEVIKKLRSIMSELNSAIVENANPLRDNVSDFRFEADRLSGTVAMALEDESFSVSRDFLEEIGSLLNQLTTTETAQVTSSANSILTVTLLTDYANRLEERHRYSDGDLSSAVGLLADAEPKLSFRKVAYDAMSFVGEGDVPDSFAYKFAEARAHAWNYLLASIGLAIIYWLSVRRPFAGQPARRLISKNENN